jgi:hypothetical protein
MVQGFGFSMKIRGFTPASIESRVPLRASFRLARGDHGPTASIPAPPAGAFNALTFAGAESKANPRHYAPWNHASALLRQLPWHSHPRHCATLCCVVSNNPVALCHPLPYGWRPSPSRRDGGALEGKTNNYATSVQVQRRDARPAGSVTPIAIGLVRLSPPSQVPSRPLHRHPRHCGSVRRWDAATPATVPPYGLASTAPLSPHTGDRRTRDRYTITLEAAPGRAQDAP